MSDQLAIATTVIPESAVLVAIERADLAPSTKTKYRRAVEGYLATGASLTDAEALASYATELPASGRAFLKAAVGKWASHMVNQVKARPAGNPGDVLLKQEAIYRFEALQEAITVRQPAGSKAHVWLTPAEVRRLMALPGDDVAGRRDRVALGLLVAAGLRRREAVHLTYADVKLQAVRERLRTVLDVAGKGDKQRQVPISDQLAAALDAWSAHVGGEGLVLRSVSASGEIGGSLSAVGLFKLVQRYGAEIGRPELAPHDLLRTYAQIGYDSGVPITQISIQLGHATVATTQRYLSLDLDLTTTVSDFVPM